MNPLKSGRVRVVLIAGVVLAAIGATALVVANTSSAAESSRWVTATATKGDVTQTFTATGSVTRKNTDTASFAVSGTVDAVKVAVGDKVDAGQVLATIDPRALKLAVLQAETTVAQAELNLYNAQHPSSGSTAKKASSSAASAKSKGSGSKTTTPGLTTVTLDLAALNEAVSGVNLAVVDEAKQCDAIMAWVNEELPGSSDSDNSSDGGSGGSSGSGSGDSTASAEPSASASPSASESSTSEPSAAESSESPTATATQYATVPDPTEDELKACATARATLITANDTLQTMMAQINDAASNPGSSSPGTGSGTGSKPSGSSGSSSSSVSASQVDSAKANLLQAEQKLQAAQDDLANAELLAPISGTVGTVSLTVGNSASAGSVTIVGEGNAVVTIEVPLKTRGTLTIGEAVSVTPAGSTTALDGKVTNISSLETSGTAGDSPTYTTTISVSDPSSRLATGAKASVTVPVKAVTGVIIVPASAVTPTGTGTATVKVLASGSDTPTSTTVETGAVGGGWVEITKGLTAGQVVVIADRTAAIPSNTNTFRRTTTSSTRTTTTSSTTRSTAAATTQPSSQPTK